MIPRIAVVQLNPTPGDIAANCRRMVDALSQARSRGAELVVFPEEAVTGYCIGDLNRNRMLVRESLAAAEQVLAPASHGLVAVVGLVAPEANANLNDGAPGARNAFLVLEDGKIVGRGAKALLVDDGVFYDSRYFLPAAAEDIRPVEVRLATTGPFRLGIEICHDMWDDFSKVRPSTLLAERGAQLLVVINSSPFWCRRHAQRVETARRRVAETGIALCYVNTCGVQDNGKNVILFDGGSFLLDERGHIAARCPDFQDGVFLLPDDGAAAVPGAMSRAEELFQALCFGLKGFFRRTGFSGAVLGLSGGIDSAVSACLLVTALGRENVLALNMPTRFSSQTTQDCARELARRLGVEYVVHGIEEIVQRKKTFYEAVSGVPMKGLSFENVQARERGNVLMTWAQERGRLVIGNGNKTEFQRGYATLYGDIVGAVMPLGDVAKTDIYRLARHINMTQGNPIPDDILTIPPSAELSEAQDVTRGLGDPFDYDIEAPMGQEIIEQVRTPAELRSLFESRALDPDLWAPVRGDRPVYDKLTPDRFEQYAWEVFRAIEATTYKRIQAPPIIKVSAKAFGFDFRESVFARLVP